MKKYIFSILLFMGCLLLGISFNNTPVEALLNVYSVAPDAHSNRNIKVDIEGLHSSTTEIYINEIEYCANGDITGGCEQYSLINANDEVVNYYFKTLKSQGYQVSYEDADAGRVSLNYRIDATSDGDKYFYINTVQGVGSNYAFFEYNLSTLEERIVVNPDANGAASHVYDGVQYSSVRQISLKVELLAGEVSTYTGEVKICESIRGNASVEDKYCGEYFLSDGTTLDYDIKSFGDGVKTLKVYLLKSNSTLDPLTIERELYLDTIGPEITIEGGTWVFVKTGTTYKEQNATCKDAIFEDDECVVTNDADVIQLNYKSDKYQFVTYSATDRLGNVRTISVKIKVEQAVAKTNYLPFIIGGSIFLVVLLILGWILIKNHQKKKKISYI